MFKSLLTVSKIGPKIALGILSAISFEQFREALENKNVDKLTGISGVGKKTAQRIILELSGKLVFDDDIKVQGKDRENSVLNDAVDALMTLGFNKQESIEAIKQTGIEINRETQLQELIKESLKRLRT